MSGKFGGSGVSDHGALTGLEDDDHSQYHTDGRGDARYWRLTTDLATQVELDAHVNDATDAHDASAVSIADAGGHTAETTAEGAIQELYATKLGGEILFDSTLGGDAAAIDTGAAGIADGYNVLEVWIIARTAQGAENSAVLITLNNDTGGNYDRQTDRAENVTASSVISLAQTSWAVSCPGNSAEAGAAGVIALTIPGYAQTTFHKACEARATTPNDTAASNRAEQQALRWRSTAAITRMAVTGSGGDLRAGSRLLIYGR